MFEINKLICSISWITTQSRRWIRRDNKQGTILRNCLDWWLSTIIEIKDWRILSNN